LIQEKIEDEEETEEEKEEVEEEERGEIETLGPGGKY